MSTALSLWSLILVFSLYVLSISILLPSATSFLKISVLNVKRFKRFLTLAPVLSYNEVKSYFDEFSCCIFARETVQLKNLVMTVPRWVTLT